MPKFYLIDESLCDVRGHHYGFARLVLEAAMGFGYEIVLATHQSFAAALPPAWRVFRLYPDRLYDDPLLMPCGELPAGGQTTLNAAANWLERGRRWRYASQRQRWIADHAAATRTLFAQSPLGAGDQVFFAAASEATVRSLALFADRGWPSSSVDFHLLFHFNPFAGLPPDHGRQPVRRRHFTAAFAQLDRAASIQHIHSYTTTDELTEQFQLICPGRSTTLGYPLDPIIRAVQEARTASEPLRIVFAGDARLEKGYQHLPDIVEALEPERAAGKARFLLQSNFPFAIPCRRRNLPLVAARERLARYPHQHVRLLCDPLDPAEYHALIAQADIGVLPYDPVHYHARCSGVLLEMLSAGVPVVVPAGGWMAEQVATSGAGLIAQSVGEFPYLIRKILSDYNCYAAAARDYSSDLLRRRHPRRFVADLLSHSAALARQQQTSAA